MQRQKSTRHKVTHTWDIPNFSLYKLVHTDSGNWGIWKKKYTADNGKTYKGFALKFYKRDAGYMVKMIDDFDRQRTIALHIVIMSVLSPDDKSNCVKFIDNNRYNLRLDNMVWADGPNQRCTEDPNIAIQKYNCGIAVGRIDHLVELTGLPKPAVVAISQGRTYYGWVLAPHARTYAPGFYEAIATK